MNFITPESNGDEKTKEVEIPTTLTLISPAASSSINGTFALDFTLPQTAKADSVKLTLTDTSTPALTINGASSLPWTTTNSNGWTQVRHRPQGTADPQNAPYYSGNLISHNGSSTVYDDGPSGVLNATPQTSASSVEWGKSWDTVSNWDHILFATIDADTNTGNNLGKPSYWVIYSKAGIAGFNYTSGHSNAGYNNDDHVASSHTSTLWRWHGNNNSPEISINSQYIFLDADSNYTSYLNVMLSDEYTIGVFIGSTSPPTDNGSPHIITFASTFESPGRHTMTVPALSSAASASNIASVTSNGGTAANLENEHTYTVKLEYQDESSNPYSTENANVTIDPSAPNPLAPMLTSPAASSSIASSFTLDFTLPQTAKADCVKLTLTNVPNTFENLPWMSSTKHHGWTQIKHLPQGSTGFYNGNDFTKSGDFGTIQNQDANYSDDPNSGQWQIQIPSPLDTSYDQICFQTLAPGDDDESEPHAWAIITKDAWNNTWQSPGAYITIDTVATQTADFGPLKFNIHDSDPMNPMLFYYTSDFVRPLLYLEQNVSNYNWITEHAPNYGFSDYKNQHGLAVYVRNSSDSDPSDPRVITFATPFETAGQHTMIMPTLSAAASHTYIDTVTPAADLVSGQTYTIKLEYQDESSNPYSIEHSNITVDSSLPHPLAPTLTSPAASSSISGPFTLDFTLPETANSGTVKLTLTNSASGAGTVINSPWISNQQKNGWTQIKHMPQGSVWYEGDDITISNNAIVFGAGRTKGDPTDTTLEWQLPFSTVPNWDEFCVQTTDDTGGAGPSRWAILKRSEFEALSVSYNGGLENTNVVVATSATGSSGLDFVYFSMSNNSPARKPEIYVGGQVAVYHESSFNSQNYSSSYVVNQHSVGFFIRNTTFQDGPHVITFASGFETKGSHTMIVPALKDATHTNIDTVTSNGGTAADLVDGQKYTIKLEYQDANSNSHSIEHSNITVDSSLPHPLAPMLTSPAASSSIQGAFALDFTLPQVAKANSVKLTLTDSTGIPHIITFATTFESAGQHTMIVPALSNAASDSISNIDTVTSNGGTAADLVDAQKYTIKLEYQDANSNSYSTEHSNITVDSSLLHPLAAPMLTSPAANTSIHGSFVLDFTLPLAAKANSVKLIFMHISGTSDVGSPHIITFATTFESAGQHTMIVPALSELADASHTNIDTVTSNMGDASDLVEGATYIASLEYQDFMGNITSVVSNQGIELKPAVAMDDEPWTVDDPNGWTQVMHMDKWPSPDHAYDYNWYKGNTITRSVPHATGGGVVNWSSTSYNYTPGVSDHTSSSDWSSGFPASGWNEICFQSIESSPSFWVIFNKTDIDDTVGQGGHEYFWATGPGIDFRDPLRWPSHYLATAYVKGASHDRWYVAIYDHPRSPIIYPQTGPNHEPASTVRRVLFAEDQWSGHLPGHQPYYTPCGVFIRNKP